MLVYIVKFEGVKSLWGDCRFIPADWGSYIVVDLCYFAMAMCIFEIKVTIIFYRKSSK